MGKKKKHTHTHTVQPNKVLDKNYILMYCELENNKQPTQCMYVSRNNGTSTGFTHDMSNVRHYKQ